MLSFEVRHVHGLWHLDFHEGSRAVLTSAGRWDKPWLFGCLDDRSRLACHLQWYMVESTETLVHGFSQGILKRGLPRALLSDNGGAETAAERRGARTARYRTSHDASVHARAERQAGVLLGADRGPAFADARRPS